MSLYVCRKVWLNSKGLMWSELKLTIPRLLFFKGCASRPPKKKCRNSPLQLAWTNLVRLTKADLLGCADFRASARFSTVRPRRSGAVTSREISKVADFRFFTKLTQTGVRSGDGGCGPIPAERQGQSQPLMESHTCRAAPACPAFFGSFPALRPASHAAPTTEQRFPQTVGQFV